MTAFASAIDLLFDDPNIAQTATFEPAYGNPVPVRIIARRADTVSDFGEARLWSDSTKVDLRVSEVLEPQPGEQLTIGAETFVIQGEPVRDRERLVWTLNVRMEE